MKKFQLTVSTQLDYLTLGDSSPPFTSVTTEIMASDENDLLKKFRAFLEKVDFFHGMSTGTSKPEAELIVSSRRQTIWKVRDATSINFDDVWDGGTGTFQCGLSEVKIESLEGKRKKKLSFPVVIFDKNYKNNQNDFNGMSDAVIREMMRTNRSFFYCEFGRPNSSGLGIVEAGIRFMTVDPENVCGIIDQIESDQQTGIIKGVFTPSGPKADWAIALMRTYGENPHTPHFAYRAGVKDLSGKDKVFGRVICWDLCPE